MMINWKLVTVRLHVCGCHFNCAYCGHARQHPPADLWYYIIGYGFCDWCGKWMPIEGGDKMGIAPVLKGNKRSQ
ncbi:MAG TPA: hypothetical protein VIW80_00085 [Pyrinomonadaceae bacterium]|jgi:hypothetical protein